MFVEQLDLQQVTISQTEQKKRLAQTTIQHADEELGTKPEDQPGRETASWSQEAHESVQATSSQHLRAGVEFDSKDAGTLASATLSQEVPNAFQTRVQPVSEEAVFDTTDRKVDTAKASVGSTEITQHMARIQPVAESTQDHADQAVETGKASLSHEASDRVHTTTIQQTGEALKKRTPDVTAKQKATLSREAGDNEIVSTSQTVSESLMNRKNEQVSERAKATVRREAKSKTSMTTVTHVGETESEYGEENGATERAVISHEEPEKIASTNIQTTNESVKEGIQETRRKTSRASMSQAPQDISATQMIQITGEVVSEQSQMKPDSAKAKISHDNLEASQMRTAEVITAGVAFDSSQDTRRTSVAKLTQEELEPAAQTTIQTVGEFVTPDSGDFKPETDRATVALEKPRKGTVKSVEVASEEVSRRKESVGELGKAEVRQDKLRTTKTSTVEAVSGGVLFESEDTKSLTRKAAVGQEQVSEPLPATTLQTVSESVSIENREKVPKERAVVRPESQETGLVQTTSTSEESTTEAPKAKPRKEKAKKTLGTEKLEATGAKTVETATGGEPLEMEEKPETEVASLIKVQSQTAASTTVQALEGAAEYSKADVKTTTAMVVQEEQEESHQQMVQPTTERVKAGIKQVSLEKERAQITKDQKDTAQVSMVQTVSEEAKAALKPVVKKDRATVKQEESGQIQLTKVQTGESLQYETEEQPDKEKATVIQTAPETVPAETTQHIIEEVATTRKEKAAEKVKAKPKQDKLKPIGKTQTEATNVAEVVDREQAKTSKASVSIEESERVLPTRGFDTVTEKVTETEEFEIPEECTAVQIEEIQEPAEKPKISKEAKIIEVR